MKKSIGLFILGFLYITYLPDARGQQKDSVAVASSAYFFRSLMLDSIPISEVPKLIESMSAIEVSSGNIFLSGNGFRNVIQKVLDAGRTMYIDNEFIDRFRPGTRITLEKVLIIDKTGKKRAPVTKTFIIKAG